MKKLALLVRALHGDGVIALGFERLPVREGPKHLGRVKLVVSVAVDSPQEGQQTAALVCEAEGADHDDALGAAVQKLLRLAAERSEALSEAVR